MSVIKQTSQLEVLCQDNQNGSITYKLENPIENLSLSNIQDAFSYAFETTSSSGINWLQTVKGSTVIAVLSAQYVETVITKTQVE